MKVLLPAAAVAAMVCTVLATLTAIVFCLGMGANSSSAEIRTLNFWMAGFALLGIAGVVAGIILMRANQHGWAATAAFIPTALMAVIFIVAVNLK
ncbi:hypothetical protein [Horticoccus sp. 23ND18S-11]|uniref:hypothetical protein n=1 Tax=Horticoccus sp. 23ND18S-11 TaxID=3391832 RepID=UPI0039C956DC